jgi:hypothetical protein
MLKNYSHFPQKTNKNKNLNQTVDLLNSKGIIINQDSGEIKKIIVNDEEVFYLKIVSIS